jgi:hypothetical protein
MLFTLQKYSSVDIRKKLRPIISYDFLCILILIIIVAGLYVPLRKQGDIYFPDSSRHAMNGVFVLDFLRAMPLRHPIEFAYDYYRQLPGLTILFYPPLFYVALAGFYSAFGVSEAAALATELAFLLLLGWGAFRLSRHWLEPLPALVAALLLVGAPEVLYWGRQIMLDIPAYVFLVWSAEFLVRHLKKQSPWDLYAAVLCAVAAVYTKYNAVFFAATIAISLVYLHGWRVVFDRTVWRAAAFGTLAMLPVVAIFFAFGHYNLEQAASIPEANSRWSVASLTYYARVMPEVMGWPTVVLACLFVAALPFAPKFRLSRNEGAFLVAWLASGYVFYAMISLKYPRDILFITFPIPLCATLFVDRGLAGSKVRIPALLALAVAVWATGLITRPIPYVTGMREAAETVARVAPSNSNVAFWGSLDGTFIYAMRAYTDRRDLGVVRLDKLLFRDLAIEFERGGFAENVMTPEQITDLLYQLHVQYVVVQSGYHTEFDTIKMLEQALHSDKFSKIEQIPMTSNMRFPFATGLDIYRLKRDVPEGRVAPAMQIRILGRSL